MDILKMSIAASVLILLTVTFRFLFNKVLSKNMLMLLWGVVCCKLMIPTTVLHSYKFNFIKNETAALDTAGLLDIPTGFYQLGQTEKIFDAQVLPIIWMIGVAGIALYFLRCYTRCTGIFQMALQVKDMPFINQWLDSKHLHRKVVIRVSDRIASPMTYGILRPVILLPKTMNLDNLEYLRYVLGHEMAHIKRFDSLWKICLAVVLSCHWFNPLVWVMYYFANRDMELACDDMMTRTLSRKQCASYATMLVEWDIHKTIGNPLASCLMENFMEERIRNIMKKRKLGITGIVLSMALFAGAATVYASTPTVSRTATESQQINDPTLGGIFELYTPEEFEQVIDNIKKHGSSVTSQDIISMEDNLARLRADQGKNEYVIYKSAFNVTKTVDGGSIAVGFNPTIVMAPHLMKWDTPLTAETYRKEIESIAKDLRQSVLDGYLTSAQLDAILNKMNDNLAKMK